MSIPLTNEEAMGMGSIQSSLPLPANPEENWDHILDKLNDPTKDPFEKMFIVMYELMPAITTYKEEELEELGGGLEQTAALIDKLTQAQTAFNKLKEENDPAQATIYRTSLEDLKRMLDSDEDSNWLDPELRAQTKTTVDDMLQDIYQTGLGNDSAVASNAHAGIWSQAENTDYSGDAHYNSNTGSRETWNLKGTLDDFNTVGTSLKNTSGVIQARFQFEVGNYETFVGIYKDMFKNWRSQLQSPLTGMRG
jgi:hypothetical protein